MPNTPSLLRTPRFLPLFTTQFLGAFNDNLFKTALIMLLTFQIGSTDPTLAAMLVNIVSALFILPFFLFSALAGQLADKYSKPTLIRWVKFVEIPITVCGGFALIYHNLTGLFLAVFLMGVHSAFFGPLKYSILPEHLAATELIEGNALIEGGTFLAILLGTILGGLVILQAGGTTATAILVVLTALVGFATSYTIPHSSPANPELTINKNLLAATRRILRHAYQDNAIFRAIIGISWFWTLGAIFVAQFPSFAKHSLDADEKVATLFLAIFSIGIAIGSYLCHRALREEVSTRLVLLGAIGITVFVADLVLAASSISPLPGPSVRSVVDMVSSFNGIRVVFDLLMTSICSAFYIVPLYALIQHRSAPTERARTIAANNIMNALFMVLGSLCAVALISFGLTTLHLFIAVAVTNIVLAYGTRQISTTT